MIEKIFYASAGTGKTESLLNIVFTPNANPEDILRNLKRTVFLSFSNATKDELTKRIFMKLQCTQLIKSGLTVEILQSIRVFTLHGFAVKILRENIHPKKFILPADAQLVESKLLWELEVERYLVHNNVGYHSLGNVLKKHGELLFYAYDLLKDNLSFEVKAEKDNYFGNFKEHLENIGKNFISKCIDDNIFTFDSAVYFFLKYHVDPDPEAFFKALEDQGEGIDCLIIDEVQDNDLLQNIFLSLIHNVKNIKIYIAGDPKQAIYFFRGAVPEFLYKLKEEAKVLNIVEFLKESKRIENESLFNDINKVYTGFKEYGRGKYQNWHFDDDGNLTKESQFAQNLNIGLECFTLLSGKRSSKESKNIFKDTIENIFNNTIKNTIKTFVSSQNINTIGIIIQDRNLLPYALEISTLLKREGFEENLKLDVTLDKLLRLIDTKKDETFKPLLLLLLTYSFWKFELERELKKRPDLQFSPGFILLNDSARALLNRLASKFSGNSSITAFPTKLLKEAINQQSEGTVLGKFVSFVLENIPIKYPKTSNTGLISSQTKFFDYDRAVLSIIARLVAEYYKYYKFGKDKLVDIEDYSLPPPSVTEPITFDHSIRKASEIITIHQSKGKTYDATIVFWWYKGDPHFKCDLNPIRVINGEIQFDRGILYLPEIREDTTLIFKCEEALVKKPKIKVCTPDHSYQQNSPNDHNKNLPLFEQLDKERFNLAYVALTRARYFTVVFSIP
ncbi:MAG: UvrD-helicase domain-containing protein [candidate division WOR-3 bacterium]